MKFVVCLAILACMATAQLPGMGYGGQPGFGSQMPMQPPMPYGAQAGMMQPGMMPQMPQAGDVSGMGFQNFVPVGQGMYPSQRNSSFGFRATHGQTPAEEATPTAPAPATPVGTSKEAAKVCIDVAKTVCKEPTKGASDSDHPIKPTYVGSLADKTSAICAGDSCPPATKAALKAYDSQLSKVEHEKNVVAEIKGLIQVYTKKQAEVQKKLAAETAALAKAKAAITATQASASVSGSKAKMSKTQQLNNELAGNLQRLQHLTKRFNKLDARTNTLKTEKERATAQVAEIKRKLAVLSF